MGLSTPSDIRISDYFYALPEERIAHYPLENRDESKLLVWRNQRIEQSVYRQLPSHLPSAGRLVFNNTRVIPARLYFRKETGATVEIFLLEPAEEERHSLPEPGRATWNCLVGKAGKWKHGQVLTASSAELELSATIVGKEDKNFIIRFSWNNKEAGFFDVIRQLGNIPLPPYIKRKPESSDLERYQTVYSKHEGSVAAPTAGLHFTPALLESLQEKGISLEFLTLHVGAGTFLPVKSETMAGHNMHAEWMDLDIKTIEDLANYTGELFAVGTTSLRTLESLYWMGVKLLKNPELPAGELPVRQWEVYASESVATRKETLLALADWMKRQSVTRLFTTTEILIAPPYRTRMIAGLITNFHQPNSTLLLLIAAITGEKWREIYNYALANDFRFLSYGDGCLLYV